MKLLASQNVGMPKKKLTQLIQSECIKNKIDYLLSNNDSKNRERILLYVNQFNLFLDNDSILRCRARVGILES